MEEKSETFGGQQRCVNKTTSLKIWLEHPCTKLEDNIAVDNDIIPWNVYSIEKGNSGKTSHCVKS